jgi:two-component system, response regulator PdtaR
MVPRLSVRAANGSIPLVVLLVEDELVMRWSVADSLREAGFTVIEAASGHEATSICRSDVSVHLLFTDINLLGSDTGLDVAEYFRTHRPEVPVLYTSGKEIDAARRVHGSEFLPKPYQLENAVSACRRLCTK